MKVHARRRTVHHTIAHLSLRLRWAKKGQNEFNSIVLYCITVNVITYSGRRKKISVNAFTSPENTSPGYCPCVSALISSIGGLTNIFRVPVVWVIKSYTLVIHILSSLQWDKEELQLCILHHESLNLHIVIQVWYLILPPNIDLTGLKKINCMFPHMYTE